MELIHHYAKLKDIQNILTRHKEATGTCFCFPDAVMRLYTEGKVLTDPGVTPDYTCWDGKSFEHLKKLYEEGTVDVTDILRNPVLYTSELPEKLSFLDKDIWPMFLFNDEGKHLHTSQGIEVLYVLSGCCNLELHGSTRSLEEGTFCIIAPETEHDTQATGKSVVLDVIIKRSTLDKAFSSILRTNTPMSSFFMNCLYGETENFLLFMCPASPYINGLIRRIFMEGGSSKSYANEITNSYFEILLAEVLRAYTSTYLHSSTKRSTNVQMPLILSYIKTNFRSTSLKQTAAFFGYDPDYLGKMIRKSTGMYYNDIINQYKTGLAQNLLLYSDHSISEIAEETGFNSTDHFTRTFRKHYGVTPAKFRKLSHY